MVDNVISEQKSLVKHCNSLKTNLQGGNLPFDPFSVQKGVKIEILKSCIKSEAYLDVNTSSYIPQCVSAIKVRE